ncbi:serine protease inhibitor 28Dc [Diachasma alloeum]|uniref:serine protease inhibitor 28Dc n=1 Tax=Diachasma alloeum TaxID=454923 RepID=UPI0007383595|nr:serine protease inhibitor 28Dc [Diachasma alloeum]
MCHVVSRVRRPCITLTMTKIFLIVISLIIGIHCQLIFPDEFERFEKISPPNGNQSPPFPTFPPNTYPISEDSYTPVINNIQQAKSIQITLSKNHNNNNNNNNGLSSFGSSNTNRTDEKIYWNDYVNNLIIKGVMKFALDMNHAIDADQQELSMSLNRQNVVFSPISLVATLAIVLLGSAGKTFDQVEKILGLSSDIDISSHSEIVHEMLALLLASIDTRLPINATGPQVKFANGIFIQAGYPIRPEFLAISQGVYNNEAINVDFMRQSVTAQRIINNWVDMKTHGKIKNILTQAPNPETKIIFASSLYFNGEWNKYFLNKGTKRKPFTLASGQTVDVDMMYNGGDFPFYRDQQLGIEIVGLPYKNSAQSPVEPTDFRLFESTMYILLPISTDPNALKTLQSTLTPDLVEQLILHMENEHCVIGLPRMKLSSTLHLKRALESLGLISLFRSDQANLALLSAGPNRPIPNIIPTTSDPLIFTRINNEDPPGTAELTSGNFTGRNNYFKYEDKQGGYKVQQWNNGVFVEKIIKSERQRRQLSPESVKKKSRLYKRQINRPIGNDFSKFIERQGFSNYGLDALRNNAHLVNPGLYASDVVHKVEIDITETGTVAAAATSATITRTAHLFIANRPFIFFIRHGPSRLILFWGSINQPTPNYSKSFK